MANPNDKAVRRYSDDELQEFKDLIDRKINHTTAELESLERQIAELNEQTADNHSGDFIDGSNLSSELALVNDMAMRQRKYLQDLQHAMVRIRNKTYGICAVTGELIDRRRLLAVPTTTKSLAAKTRIHQETRSDENVRLTDNPYVKKERKPRAPKVITRIIRPVNKAAQPELDLEDDELDLGTDDSINFDELVIDDDE